MPRLSSHSADMPPSTRLRVFVAAIALLAGAAARPLPVAAQTTTTIAGTVTDRTGAALPGAAVTAHHAETGLARSAVSNARGRYTLASLPVGSWEVRPDSSRSSAPASSRRSASAW